MLDVAIIGGGIAGLWTLRTLRRLSYNAHLFEKTALGAGQTIASQGIIHGGMKYALDGVSRPQCDTLAGMPKRWTEEMPFAASRTRQMLFTQNAVTAFAASLALRGKTEQIEREEWPAVFQHMAFAGTVYRLGEPVYRVADVLAILAEDCTGFVHLGRPAVSRLTIHASGLGNELQTLKTQRRPLRMFMVGPMGYEFFGHCVVNNPKPRVTITSHRLNDAIIWYLGGSLAEQAAKLDRDEAVAFAKKEMREIFPWLDWRGKQWAALDIDRAEPATDHFTLPNRPKFITEGNIAIAWPSKMALAPLLADELAEWVQGKIQPTKPEPMPHLPVPQIAKYPWETAHFEP